MIARPLLEQSPYQSYAYAYPHKTAYRALDPVLPLSDVWRREDHDALFLYLHVPYCEMRCGFCNLFTTVGDDAGAHDRYLDAVERQCRVVSEALGPARFGRAAIGGGTPTLLAPEALARLFDIVRRAFGVDFRHTPLSVESSPATALPDQLAVLEAQGTRRVSIGVQSFVEAEVRAAGRPQRNTDVERALGAIRDRAIDVLNIDLMYGLKDQTADTWRHSLDRALEWKPEEIFLYPLYVRPLTGLDRTGRSWDDHRVGLYRQGRDHLLAQGYEQFSMRLFRRPGPAGPRTRYRCQADGMVGLGAGARSYTSGVHYATEWGVGRQRVRSILEGFVGATDAQHGVADSGFVMCDDERQRRHIQQSLLCAEGLHTDFYAARFGGPPLGHHPQLEELVDAGLAVEETWGLRLTDAGIERSDAIGPWLTSPRVRQLMARFDLR